MAIETSSERLACIVAMIIIFGSSMSRVEKGFGRLFGPVSLFCLLDVSWSVLSVSETKRVFFIFCSSFSRSIQNPVVYHKTENAPQTHTHTPISSSFACLKSIRFQWTEKYLLY